MMTELHIISSVMALFSALLICRGFFPFAKLRPTGPVSAMAAGITIAAGAVLVRVLYWGILPPILNTIQPGLWITWYEASGGRRMNVVFNTALVASTYYVLTSLWLLIPDRDRKHWSFLSAPFYPNKRHLIVRILSQTAQRNAINRKKHGD